MKKDSFVESTRNLKKAVPLMIKHKVPTTPTNYALWYTYVSDSHPKLNAQMDETLKEHGTCGPSHCEDLYRDHLADHHERDFNQLRRSFQALAQEMGSTMADTINDTSNFQETLEDTFSQLARVEEEGLSIEETMALVKNMVKESRGIRSSTLHFKTQLKDAQKEIARLREELNSSQQDALHDGLTGILNRRAFDAELANFAAHHDIKNGFCLCMTDLDHFKSFNDNYGHWLGDQVLKMVAQRLESSCRDGMMAFRYGGEEFAILIPGKKLGTACRIADSIRSAVSKLTIRDRRKGTTVDKMTLSIGVAEFNPGEPVDSLIERADKQLYEAKKLGRNRVMPLS
ncbi:GGDEF domain-containing protein [Parasalinivibrio latis]|uniref:GGDEF domain-containing protein n=1 Tax=Parasalinivibrio latis TaxID=2952610 RepID=UPI0030E53722